MEVDDEKNIPSRAEALRIAEECAKVLRERFGVAKVYPFGSVTGVSPWQGKIFSFCGFPFDSKFDNTIKSHRWREIWNK